LVVLSYKNILFVIGDLKEHFCLGVVIMKLLIEIIIIISTASIAILLFNLYLAEEFDKTKFQYRKSCFNGAEPYGLIVRVANHSFKQQEHVLNSLFKIQFEILLFL